MYGMYHHSTWAFAPPLFLTKGLKKPTLTLENGEGYVSDEVQAGAGEIIRRNGTGKYNYKSFSFPSQKKDVSVAQHGRISRGREYSHHAMWVMDLTHLRYTPNAKSNLTCPKLPP